MPSRSASQNPTPRRLLVIDGANSIFRAFFAIPHLRAPDGSPTNAAYGFVNMLTKLLREEQPDFVAVAYDARGGTFRHELYGDYKAGRDATPEDLAAQIPLVKELIAAHGIPLIEAKSFEADDVIATLAAHAPEDVHVLIVSTDKDLMQLVSERVTLIDGMKDRRYEPSDVEERFGVPPSKMLDLRALVGDPSDNIPGVKGIGEKGAAKLVQEWGTLEQLLEHAGDVKAKRAREALSEHADAARLSKQLATLRDDVPIDLPFDGLARKEPDRERLLSMYKELGFTRLVDALSQTGDAGPAEAPPAAAADVVTTASALAEQLETAADRGSIALVLIAEPGSAVDATPVGLAVATGERAGFYAPFCGEPLAAKDGIAAEEAFERLAGVLAAKPDRGWISAGAKQVQSLAAERGHALPLPADDVELAAFLLDPSGAQSLSSIAPPILGREIEAFEAIAGRGAKAVAAGALEVEKLAAWAVDQACAARDLAPLLRGRLVADELLPLYEQVELPLTAVLSRIERNGVRIDEAKLAALKTEYGAELDRIEAEIYSVAGEEFKINSPKQLQVVLFDKLKLTPIKKTKTGFSTDEGVLEQLAAEHELPGRILAWRRLAKLVSTYIDALPPLVSERSGRIHPIFHQTGAATGRLSCSNPNVQNIPIRTPEGIRIREAFVAREGAKLLSADYSQVELRILAHFSGDESLIDAFAKKEDVHRRTAAEVAGIPVAEVSDDQRARAKAVNFGIIYGSSAFGLANNLGIATSEAQATIDAYFARYQGVRRFLDETIERAKERGYVLTLLGRRRYLPDLRSKNRVLRQAAERMAVNTVIQGTAADLIKQAMVEVQEALDEAELSSLMILQVHDELVFEVPEGEREALAELVRTRMESVFELAVPLDVDLGLGESWRDAH